jgi:two-component system, NarL family, response regulator LiaR
MRRAPVTHHPSIRVLVVDDHPLMRLGLAAMLRAADDLSCVGEAATGAEAVAMAAERFADVVLMDLMLPHVDGIGATSMLRRYLPECKVLLISSRMDGLIVQAAMKAGASGYVPKTTSAADLAMAIRGVRAGRHVLPPDVMAALTDAGQPQATLIDLTQRERDVLEGLVDGRRNQEIAQVLGISVPAVKFHVTHIFEKLQVSSRTEAAMEALRQRLVDREWD